MSGKIILMIHKAVLTLLTVLQMILCLQGYYYYLLAIPFTQFIIEAEIFYFDDDTPKLMVLRL